MTIATFNGGFYWPEPVGGHRSSQLIAAFGTLSSLTIDASGEKVGHVFIAPKTGNIDRVFAYASSKTSDGTLDVTLETIDPANGNPSGTLVTANASGTFSNNASPQTIDVTLTAAGAVTIGEQYALVISQNAGNCAIQIGSAVPASSLKSYSHRRCYTRHYTGGAWATGNSVSGRFPCLAIRYDDGNYYYIPGVLPISTVALTTFNNTSATRERGLCFTLTFPARVSGFYFNGSASLSDHEVILAASDGTALATFSGDKDKNSSYYTYAAGYSGYFSTPVDLAANTKYYLTLKPTSGSNVSLHEVTMISGASIAAQMGMMNGGTAAYLVTRDSGGTYTEVTTQRPIGTGIICSGFDDGAGGGGVTFVGGVSANIVQQMGVVGY